MSQGLDHVELRRLAARLMHGEQPGHTLRPTALAHEAWLKLQASRNAQNADRDALLGLAAWSMRRILIDHARRRQVRAARRTTLSGKLLPAAAADATDPSSSLLHLDQALRDLAEVDPQLARLVELRFFAGATVAETARSLGVSTRTVKRRWAFARAFLHHELAQRDAGKAGS